MFAVKKAPIILLAVILVGVAWLGFSRERKLPSISHVGKPVEQWIQELRDDDYAVRDSAEDALREMGEACVPYLIQSLGEKDSELKKAVMKLGGDFARSHFSPSEAHLNREAAAKALALMPEAGESAVLALAARLTDDYSPAAEEAQRRLRARAPRSQRQGGKLGGAARASLRRFELPCCCSGAVCVAAPKRRPAPRRGAAR